LIEFWCWKFFISHPFQFFIFFIRRRLHNRNRVNILIYFFILSIFNYTLFIIYAFLCIINWNTIEYSR
jgi:hypothetical protein